jgi:hypothetical protein
MKFVVALAFAACAVGVVGYIAPTLSSGGRFLTECEADFIGALRSPATYDRVDATDLRYRAATSAEQSSVRQVERDRFLRANGVDTSGDWTFEAGKLRVASLKVTYDAANAYGTPVRGTFACEQMIYDQQEIDPAQYIHIRSED